MRTYEIPPHMTANEKTTAMAEIMAAWKRVMIWREATHGRGPRGERLRSPIPHGHWKTTTFVAALRTSGMVAPMVLDGPINGIAFQAYVDQVLVPELEPGDIVVMDTRGVTTGGLCV